MGQFTSRQNIREITISVDILQKKPELSSFAPSDKPETLDIFQDYLLEENAVTANLPIDAVYLLLQVTDTGVGLDPHQQALLFQKYSQAPKTQTTVYIPACSSCALVSKLRVFQYGGSGLGLFISKRLAEMLGGWSW